MPSAQEVQEPGFHQLEEPGRLSKEEGGAREWGDMGFCLTSGGTWRRGAPGEEGRVVTGKGEEAGVGGLGIEEGWLR